MKLLRSGGTNSQLDKDDNSFNEYGFGNYFMLQIKPQIDELLKQNKTIALCVSAKQNKNHYTHRLTDLGYDINEFIVLGRDDTANWSEYSGVILFGGDTKKLYEWLQNTEFSLEALKKCEILAGDSAGAYVLARKTLIDYEKDGSYFKIIDGFLPGLNQLVAAHINNSSYHKSELGLALDKWCRLNKVEYLGLRENQVVTTEI